GQVGIRPANSGDESADCRKHALEINPIKLADRSPRLAEIEDPTFTVRPQQAKYFAQACVIVCQITETDRRRNEIELLIGKWQTERISFYPAQRCPLRFAICQLQHCVGKIHAEDFRAGLPCPATQSESHVPAAATEIDHPRVWPLQNGRKAPRRLPPPPTVHVEGKHMVEQIVPRRYRSEHFTHRARR